MEGLTPDEVQRAQQLAAAAQASLTASTRHLGSGSFDSLALKDPLAADMVQHLQPAAAPLGARAAAAVSGGGMVLAAVAAALPAAFQGVWSRVLQLAVGNLQAVQEGQQGGDVEMDEGEAAAATQRREPVYDCAAANLHVLHTVLAAVAAARAELAWAAGSSALEQPLQQVLGAAQQLGSFLAGAAAGAEPAPASLQQCQVLLLQLWQDLVACGATIPAAALAESAQHMARVATTSADEPVDLKYGWQGQARVHSTALAALQQLQKAGVLQGEALQAAGHVLVQALVAPGEAWQRQRALQVCAPGRVIP